MSMSFRARIAVILALGTALIASDSVLAQQNNGEMPRELRSKQMFVSGLVQDQSVIDRIQASSQPEAKQLLQSAQDHFSSAETAIAKAEFKQAESLLDDALSEMVKARRLVPDTQAQIARQRKDFSDVVESTELYEKSFLSYSKRTAVQAEESKRPGERVVTSVKMALDHAKSLASEGKWDRAIDEGRKANQEMKFELGKILGLTIVEIVQKFDSPAAEYENGIERNNTLLELIPVAVSELRPLEDTKLTIDELLSQNKAVLELAAEYARLHDYNKALINLHTGIGYLEVALTAAGIILPQEIRVK